VAAKFKREADFGLTRFGSDVFFHGACLGGDTVLRNSRLRTLVLAADGKVVHIGGTVDLHGCVYDALDPPSAWESFLNKEKQKLYDRQPYTYLESIFRAVGNEDLANRVYRAGKTREAEVQEKKDRGRVRHASTHWTALTARWRLGWHRVTDRLWHFLSGYGTQPWWWWVLVGGVVVLVGTVVFSWRGATCGQEDGADHIGEKQSRLRSWWRKFRLWWRRLPDAFWVSLTAFLPVPIPAGAVRKASSARFLWVSFTKWWYLLRLAGWVVVPVAIAGVTGLLKR